ncbi:hypothetical protein C3747_19g176 [Trypanosoma cruzi]|uniref:Uncharacterized protein n=2 Tax=Trypanosoma cruzi TaxID=5693 RepID=Q4D6S8_TRYCC|nr:hypothetical protein, conserved [Trypanosoma cruzi]EAN88225.1 hypothetical protein, conserved [Trypanosoma cruzi]PWV17247.1 hypothetical protein C3747_19g176 [Trypanosoma cruzi]RNC40457.1 hypothetical protein TcCL_NonESM10061 [Trypanosoma cruzi]|eukprot:XP_810076.1 hypothetical protein [Trypanosoma cruzi strain CL Brener]
MAMPLSHRSVSANVPGVRSLAIVLRACPPPSFHFFKRWGMHDFHTSKWTRLNPSAKTKRTLLGRSCIDKPTMDMVSVSRYGGNTRRETLATAFRLYRSMDQSEKAREAGQEALRAIRFTDFSVDEEEEEDLAVDFACLYLNACVLFGVAPTQEMMSQLLSWLPKSLYSSFHWECVLCALAVYLRPSEKTATAAATAAAFVCMIRGAELGTVPGSLSRDGKTLLLIVINRAIDVLLRANGRAEDRQHLLEVQLQTMELLCPTTPTPTAPSPTFSREERLTLVDTICWRYAAGVSLPIAAKLVPLLQVKTHAELEELSVSQCARLFCALCIALATQDSSGTEWTLERHSHVLDSIVRHLDERVRVHSVDDVVILLVGLQANRMARSRYKKLPSSLLVHLREQQQQQRSRQNQEADQVFTSLKSGDSLLALSHVLSQLAMDAEDALADAAETFLTDLVL